ncbi:hypothetical protein Patl1_21271 [Pistacia atlantica]|uniref:Uncharacterized protein n=1 Tax=Pistacia atlantica TaxID=434234 RepID=A0ACC1BIK3_9ROSI|nr:hypothetical protein Patl1_21271 [Pistacia atlantica]
MLLQMKLKPLQLLVKNISGEPCSGAAIDDFIALATKGYNPFIKCGCSFNEDTIYHIIGIQPLDLSCVLLASRPKRAEESGGFVGHGGLGDAKPKDFRERVSEKWLDFAEVRVEEMRIMRRIGMGFGIVVAAVMVAMAFRGFGASRDLDLIVVRGFDVNRLSGQLPKELGMLSELEFL